MPFLKVCKLFNTNYLILRKKKPYLGACIFYKPMRRFFYILGFLLLTLSANAQQDAQFSFYRLNSLFYNPAYSGVDGVTKLTLTHRSQWAGYQVTTGTGVAPTTQLFSMTSPIFKFNSGFGAFVMNDRLGNVNIVQAQASYAYHLGIKNSKLSFGIRTGAVAQIVDTDQWDPLQEGDGTLDQFTGRESQVLPDLSMGVYFRSEKYFAGVSFNHIIKSEFDFGVNDVQNPLVTHANLMFGYIHEVNFDLTLSPSILVQTADFSLDTYNFMIGGMAYYKNKMWGGLNFIQGEDINVLLGYNFLKDRSLSFGYSFGYVLAAQEAKGATSHEVVLGYELPVSPGSGKKVVRTPRFRH